MITDTDADEEDVEGGKSGDRLHTEIVLELSMMQPVLVT